MKNMLTSRVINRNFNVVKEIKPFLINKLTETNKIILIRHAESIWNHESKFTGWTDIPLSKYGMMESSVIGKTLLKNHLIPDITFTSTLDRALRTSNIIRNTMNIEYTPIHTSWRLNERHYGSLEGISRQFIKDEYGEGLTKIMRSNYHMKPLVISKELLNDNNPLSEYSVYSNCYFNTIKYGESKENVSERLLPYFENDIMYNVTEKKKLAMIVTHKHCIRVLFKEFLGIEDHMFDDFRLTPNTIYVIDMNNYGKYVSHKEIKYEI
jgi:2,3-bisphosphoglycerate-dependent phosphoglycerate mutase